MEKLYEVSNGPVGLHHDLNNEEYTYGEKIALSWLSHCLQSIHTTYEDFKYERFTVLTNFPSALSDGILPESVKISSLHSDSLPEEGEMSRRILIQPATRALQAHLRIPGLSFMAVYRGNKSQFPMGYSEEEATAIVMKTIDMRVLPFVTDVFHAPHTCLLYTSPSPRDS